MRHRALTLTTIAALALAGCTGDEPDDDGTAASASPTASPTATAEPSPMPSPDATASPTPEPSPTGQLADLEFIDCEADRYAVPYPASWDVNDESGLLEACRVFNPEGVDLPEEPQGIGLQYAAYVGIDQVPFTDVLGADVQGEVLTERETTVLDRDALVRETRSDGVALVPEGERSYSWTIDLGAGETLSVSTNSVGETDYDRDKAVVDRMVEQLELRQVEPVAGTATRSSSRTPTATGLAVTDVDIGAHPGFDRVVFEVAGAGEVGWDIAFTDDPRAQGSGQQVDVEGDAALRVDVVDAALPPEAPAPYWDDGPIAPERTAVVREVTEPGVFEGRARFFVGLDDERAFLVERLTDPQRVVIDIPTG